MNNRNRAAKGLAAALRGQGGGSRDKSGRRQTAPGGESTARRRPSSHADAFQLLGGESRLWAMIPESFEALAAKLVAGNAAAVTSRSTSVVGDTAVIFVRGPLTHRPTWISQILGASTYVEIRQRVAEAVNDAAVRRIVLLFDSPGGSVNGLPETADAIARANKTKPVVAVCDTLCASAAYWIASQAGRIVTAPSADVGSIGVFMLHTDYSRALDSAGITPTFITSRISPQKVGGNPYQPLADQARKNFQADVDAVAGQFVRAIARGRDVSPVRVTEDFGQGRTLMAAQAKAVGMVDEIGSLEFVIAGSGASLPINRSAAAVRQRRLRLLTS